MAIFNKSTVSFLLLGLTAKVQVQARPAKTRPNIIIMQPDDLPFLDEWLGPPLSNIPNDLAENKFPESYGLPHIESLRMNGVQMLQAYTASPMCGTSRYSTITGKMPSRAASVRSNDVGTSDDPAIITLPFTKLEDIGDLHDCSEENLARSFQKDQDYKTAMFGKWHLSNIEDEDYTYDHARGIVQGCGFDTVEAMYIENLSKEGGFNTYSDGSFSHNMEWMTHEAIKFINTTITGGDHFFMYFNPTVPHSSNDVELAITDFDCTAVADYDKVWDADPWIKGMSEDAGCRAYRDSILERAEYKSEDYGKIWLDDAVGALLDALSVNGELENTVFLFQEDHGMDTKSGLYEGGIRIPQFVHYPNGIDRDTTFEGLVSTVDIAATMMDFAGITPEYEMDGTSWKDAIGNTNPAEEETWKTDRCVFFEMDRDRAVRCGCYKYLHIFEAGSGTWQRGKQSGLSNNLVGNFFDLCNGTDDYITDDDDNRERNTTTVTGGFDEIALTKALECHLEHTDPDSAPNYSVCKLEVEPPTTDDDDDDAFDADDDDDGDDEFDDDEFDDDDDDDDDTSAPTCGDSPFNGIIGENLQTVTCLSISENNLLTRCAKKRFWSHCQQSCNKCTVDSDSCEDSLLTFSHGTLGNIKCGDIDLTLAQNADGSSYSCRAVDFYDGVTCFPEVFGCKIMN